MDVWDYVREAEIKKARSNAQSERAGREEAARAQREREYLAELAAAKKNKK